MKTALFMLAGCAVLSGCATRLPQAPQPILIPAAAVPKFPKACEERGRQNNEVDLTQQYIRVSGNVGHPGFYPLSPNTSTLLRAVFAADSELGATKYPLWEIHRVDGSVEVYPHEAILNGSTNDPILKPNDHVHVPRKTVVGW